MFRLAHIVAEAIGGIVDSSQLRRRLRQWSASEPLPKAYSVDRSLSADMPERPAEGQWLRVSRQGRKFSFS